MHFDMQTLINIGIGLITAVGGWFARELWGAVKSLREDLSKLREELPKDYVSKTDYREDIGEIKQMLRDISDVIHTKADK